MRSTDSAAIAVVAVLAFALCAQVAAADVNAKSTAVQSSGSSAAMVINPSSPAPGAPVIVPEPPKAVPPAPEPQPREQKRRAAAAAFQRLLRGLAPIARAAIH
jgi:hypothetical protein